MTGRVKVRPEAEAMLDPVASPKGAKRANARRHLPWRSIALVAKKASDRDSLFHSEDRCAATCRPRLSMSALASGRLVGTAVGPASVEKRALKVPFAPIGL